MQIEIDGPYSDRGALKYLTGKTVYSRHPSTVFSPEVASSRLIFSTVFGTPGDVYMDVRLIITVAEILHPNHGLKWFIKTA